MNIDLHNEKIRRQAAITSGVSLLIMTVAAIYSYAFVLESLVVKEDMIATFIKFQEARSLFRIGLVGWLIIIVTDIIVSFAFYIFLFSINKKLAKLAAALRLIYTVFLIVAVYQLLQIDILILGQDISVINKDLVETLLKVKLDSFESIWGIGLIIFGIHLFLTGYTSKYSVEIPRLWTILLIIAGLSYTLVETMYVLLPMFTMLIQKIESVLVLPMTIGELGFAIWLLIKGGKVRD